MSRMIGAAGSVLGLVKGLSRRAEWAGGMPIANILMAKTLAQPDVISLAAGFVEHASLPVEWVEEAVRRLWADRRHAHASLQYGTTIGYPPLREAILDRLCLADGKSPKELQVSVDRVVITAGSNQLLYLLSELLLDPGDIVLCGSPSYFVFLGLIQSLGARAVGVATDAQGLIPEALEETLQHLERRGELDRVKAIYVASYFDNPTGISLAEERRTSLVEIAQRWSRHYQIYIIEDLAYRDLRYEGKDLPSIRASDLDGNTVIVVGSFSKSFAPGLRVGWGLLPKALLEPVLALKGHLDFGSANFNQMVLATVLENGWFDQHLTRLQTIYREKVIATVTALESSVRSIVGASYTVPQGGLYVWIRLPEEFDTGADGELFQAAVDEGVLYVPGEYCFPPEGEPILHSCLRLSFAMPDCDRLRCGVERLARAIQRMMKT
ncbi:MAG: aminotransferase-like domain-containing protein [Thermogutta sp.]